MLAPLSQWLLLASAPVLPRGGPGAWARVPQSGPQWADYWLGAARAVQDRLGTVPPVGPSVSRLLMGAMPPLHVLGGAALKRSDVDAVRALELPYNTRRLPPFTGCAVRSISLRYGTWGSSLSSGILKPVALQLVPPSERIRLGRFGNKPMVCRLKPGAMESRPLSRRSSPLLVLLVMKVVGSIAFQRKVYLRFVSHAAELEPSGFILLVSLAAGSKTAGRRSMRLSVSNVSVRFVEFCEGIPSGIGLDFLSVRMWSCGSIALQRLVYLQFVSRAAGLEPSGFYSAREPCRRVEDSWEEQYALERVAVTFGTRVSVVQS